MHCCQIFLKSCATDDLDIGAKQATKNGQVYIADFDMFTQPSAITLVNGIEVLSKIIHPEYYELPKSLSEKFCNYFDSVAVS